jgi:pimeloyl-ACP methyl ester carboxylesterase
MSKSYEEYLPAAVDAYEYEGATVEQAVDQQAGLSSEGQQFSAIYIEQDSPPVKRPTIIRLNSLFGDTGNVDQQYIGVQYSAALPSYDYLSLDLPGHGMSDSLTKAQRRAIKRSGDLSLVSAAQVEAAVDIAPALDEVVLVGEAVGELMMLSFATQAAQKGIAVRHIYGIDPIAMESRTPIALAGNYLLNAQRSRNEHRHESDDTGEQKLEASFKEFEAEVEEKYGPTRHATRSGHVMKMSKERAIATFMLRKSPFTHDTGMTMLNDIFQERPDIKANLVFGGRSVVGRPTSKVIAMLSNLQSTVGSDHLQYDVWPHDNQDLGLAQHQPRIVAYVKDNL